VRESLKSSRQCSLRDRSTEFVSGNCAREAREFIPWTMKKSIKGASAG
jgi:hypothetical protein